MKRLIGVLTLTLLLFTTKVNAANANGGSAQGSGIVVDIVGGGVMNVSGTSNIPSGNVTSQSPSTVQPLQPYVQETPSTNSTLSVIMGLITSVLY